MAADSTVIYEPDRSIRIDFVAQWREMVADLVRSRELIWRLFLRDFQSKYKQSLLGLAWVVINPIVTIGVFVYLNSVGVLRIGSTGVPYAAFALIGLTIWNLFSSGVAAATNSIIGAGSLVTKINFPKVSLVFASYGQSLVEFIIRLILVAIALLVFRVVPSWTVIFLPFVVIPIILLTIGLGFILSLMAGLFRDVVNVVSLITTFLMFLTPILYPAPKSGIAARILVWNPLAQLVIGPRDLIIRGGFSNPRGFLLSAVFALIIFLIFWRLFYLTETKIAERI